MSVCNASAADAAFSGRQKNNSDPFQAAEAELVDRNAGIVDEPENNKPSQVSSLPPSASLTIFHTKARTELGAAPNFGFMHDFIWAEVKFGIILYNPKTDSVSYILLIRTGVIIFHAYNPFALA